MINSPMQFENKSSNMDKNEINMSNKQEPHRHHYIPQFILKKFCDTNGLICHWDIENQVFEQKKTVEVFMEIDMYRDEKQNSDNPVKIEEDFSKYEKRIAELINNKITNKNEITITRKDNEELRIFITLLSLRANYRKMQYLKNELDEETRKILLYYQPDGKFELLWKRELGVLARCRNYRKIMNNKKIDPIIKAEFKNDIEGYYMSFIETRGAEFIIGDVNPTCEMLQISNNESLPMHYLFPISPTRMILLSHIAFREDAEKIIHDQFMQNTKIGNNLFKLPKLKLRSQTSFDENDEYTYKVEKCYKNDVEYINCLILNEARKEIAFRQAKEIKESLEKYGNIRRTKNDYTGLIRAITAE